MPRYWTSWYEPVIPDSATEDSDAFAYRTPDWPDAVKVVAVWTSGVRMSDNAETRCAVLDAPTQATIENGLDGYEVRFVDKKDDDWMPPTDRFPT